MHVTLNEIDTFYYGYVILGGETQKSKIELIDQIKLDGQFFKNNFSSKIELDQNKSEN